MTTAITDTQRAIFEAAASHPNGIAAPPPGLPYAPRVTVAKAFLRARLLAAAEHTDPADAALAWKLNGDAVVLRIAAAGLREISAAPAEEAPVGPLEAARGECTEPPSHAEAAQDTPTRPQDAA